MCAESVAVEVRVYWNTHGVPVKSTFTEIQFVGYQAFISSPKTNLRESQ